MLRRPLIRAAARGVLLAAPLLASGCKGCRDEKPYTPFGVTSALPTAEPAPSASSGKSGAEGGSGGGPAIKKALFAPDNAQRWSVEGRELESPSGRVFEQAIVADFNADEKREVAAWTLPAKDAKDGSAGELWLYPSEGAPKKLSDFPGFLPTGANCTPVSALAQSAPRTLSVDVRVACTTQLVGHAPTRALMVIDPFASAERGPRFGLRAADAALGETLALDLVSRDEDGDGRDDYRLTAALSSSGKPAEISASVVFLDRAAGVSRDPREPAKSLLELLKKDTGRSQKKKTAEQALAHVDAARRLLGALCAEGATPRVFDWAGNPLRCGGLADVVDRLGAIEISAALALGDFAGALGALSRDGWYFGAMRAALREQLVKDIEKKLTPVPASRIALGVRPKVGKPPSYSPLSFEPGGALLVQGESGLYRLAPDGAREEPVPSDAGAPPTWPLEIVTGTSARWIGVAYSCDRSEASLLFSGGSGEPQMTNLLAPRPGVCGGAHFDEGFVPSPASVGDQVEALLGGALVGPKSPNVPPGSARSRDGARLAVPTPLGLWIQAEKSELWKIDSWNLSGTSGCVVDNAGRRAACVRAGRAELYLRNEANSGG
ncbi:MAG TPA: hypothetical protein VG937_30150 [Polyangiaceae bacterium]|nr:hypothetical protein [Polyangiaceae bacterium]